jgi:hypothetical protein
MFHITNVRNLDIARNQIFGAWSLIMREANNLEVLARLGRGYLQNAPITAGPFARRHQKKEFASFIFSRLNLHVREAVNANISESIVFVLVFYIQVHVKHSVAL